MGHRAATNLFDLLDDDAVDPEVTVTKAAEAAALQAKQQKQEAHQAHSKAPAAKPEEKAAPEKRVPVGDVAARGPRKGPRPPQAASAGSATAGPAEEKTTQRRDDGLRDRGTIRARGNDRSDRLDRRPREGGEHGERRREFDRHSGTGRPLNERAKKQGAGAGNWGKVGDEALDTSATAAETPEKAATTTATTTTEGETKPEGTPAATTEGSTPATEEAKPEEEEEDKTIDLKEWKKRQEALKVQIERPQERIANDGKPIEGVALERAADDYSVNQVGKGIIKLTPSHKTQAVPIDIRFSDSRRGPREGRPDRFGGDRPRRDDRPDRPREDRPRGDRPERPREDRPERPREDRPPRRDDRPREDRPPRRDDRPREDRPPRRDDRPRSDAPRSAPAAAPRSLDLKSQDMFPALKA